MSAHEPPLPIDFDRRPLSPHRAFDLPRGKQEAGLTLYAEPVQSLQLGRPRGRCMERGAALLNVLAAHPKQLVALGVADLDRAILAEPLAHGGL